MTLVLPDTARPANLRLGPGVRARVLTSDMFDICRRIAEEVSDRLYVLELAHDHPRGYRYIVMEQCDDGTDRLVIRLRDGELDARVIERLQYMTRVPFERRLAELEREAADYESKYRENSADALYEQMGAPMWRELERCGFIETRGVSFPTKSIK